MPMRNKKKNKPARRKNLLLKISVVAFVGYLAIAMVQLQIDVNAANQELEHLQKEKEEQRVKNKELQRLRDSGDSTEAVKDRLGLVYPDERVYIDVSGN